MHLDIEHEIRFNYDDFISESWVELRMEPQTNLHQTVNSFFLAVGPRTKVFRYADGLGNVIRHFSVAEYHKEIEVRARTTVETRPPRIYLANIHEPVGASGAMLDFLGFGGPITESKALRALFKSLNINKNLPLGQQVEKIGRAVHEGFIYKPNVTTYRSTIDDALKQRAGVCQDLAQITIGLLRLAGIPARYVNGYLHVTSKKDRPSESHAWIEFHSQEYGWVGYDPTGGLQPGENHVIVATGRHYDEVPPNKGVYRGTAREELSAVVRTKEIPTPAYNSFREEIREIELPVYTEIPMRRSVSVVEDQVDQASQQQQQ